ncbi:MAG: caspase family protein [Deltaproteobacteria bacterium]|nr:caspase family protein [Deltaproteobacteria bacterium]
MIGRFGLAWLAALAAAAPAAEAATWRHALVVGANDGGQSLEPLKYAEQDARRFADLVVELGGFGAEDVTVLYAPGRDLFLAALAEHARVASRHPDDLFILYYSGHADARGLRLQDEVIRFDDLKESLRSLQAEVRVGILDACRSGAIVRLKGARLTAPFLLDDGPATEGEAWLTSATADEAAQESDQIQGSFFTHYLVSGLRGAADMDDGRVSLGEAYRYAYQRTVARTGATEGGTQHPTYDYRLQGRGDLVLTEVGRGLARITIAEAVAGEVTVLRLPDRVPVAEVAKPSTNAVVLALAPGRYLLRLRNEQGLRESTVSLSEGMAPTVSEFGAPSRPEYARLKGLDELTANLTSLVDEGGRTLSALDLRHSPWIAAGASAVVPGAGQAYNGQWAKGALLFGGTTALVGGGLLWRGENEASSGSLTGPNLATLLGMTLYGYSIADAAWQVRRREEVRPRTGIVASTQTAWGSGEGSGDWPATTGIAVDWILQPGFSLGLDRTGVLTQEDGDRVFGTGGRMALGLDNGDRFRPGMFLAVGMRAGGGDGVRPVVGAGADLRWYLTPRFLCSLELREELDGGDANLLLGGGLGVHLF